MIDARGGGGTGQFGSSGRSGPVRHGLGVVLEVDELRVDQLAGVVDGDAVVPERGDHLLDAARLGARWHLACTRSASAIVRRTGAGSSGSFGGLQPNQPNASVAATIRIVWLMAPRIHQPITNLAPPTRRENPQRRRGSG